MNSSATWVKVVAIVIVVALVFFFVVQAF